MNSAKRQIVGSNSDKVIRVNPANKVFTASVPLAEKPVEVVPPVQASLPNEEAVPKKKKQTVIKKAINAL